MSKEKIYNWLLIISLALCLIGGWGLLGLPDGKTHYYFLDVGQGDASLIRLPLGQWILVDGGSGNALINNMGRLIPFFDNEIELMVITHPHADHIDGLLAVLNHYKVNNLLYTGVKYDYAVYDSILRLAAQKRVNIILSDDIHDFKIGKNYLDLIYPGNKFRNRTIDNLNNSSLIFRFINESNSVLFAGDLEKDKEADVLAENLNLKANILQVGHHGSKTSSSVEFIKAIAPKIAIISVGVDNKFDHPAAETLKTFKEAQTSVFRTDLVGTIEN